MIGRVWRGVDWGGLEGGLEGWRKGPSNCRGVWGSLGVRFGWDFIRCQGTGEREREGGKEMQKRA